MCPAKLKVSIEPDPCANRHSNSQDFSEVNNIS